MSGRIRRIPMPGRIHRIPMQYLFRIVIRQANSVSNIGWHYGRIRRIPMQYSFSVVICQANSLLNIEWCQVGLAGYCGNIHSAYWFVRLMAYGILDGARSDSPDTAAICIQHSYLSANRVENIGWCYGRISRIIAQYSFSGVIRQANSSLHIWRCQVWLARYRGNIHCSLVGLVR